MISDYLRVLEIHPVPYNIDVKCNWCEDLAIFRFTIQEDGGKIVWTCSKHKRKPLFIKKEK